MHVLPVYSTDYKCEICNLPPNFTWWYRHGQVICGHCGTTYQVYDGGCISPRIDIKPEWIDTVKKWWADTSDNGKLTVGFDNWIDKNPEHKPESE